MMVQPIRQMLLISYICFIQSYDIQHNSSDLGPILLIISCSPKGLWSIVIGVLGILSTVATDALVLKHQGISIHSAD